jgi:hypothetical protein
MIRPALVNTCMFSRPPLLLNKTEAFPELFSFFVIRPAVVTTTSLLNTILTFRNLFICMIRPAAIRLLVVE